jgi:hypothetical protein
VLADLPRAHKHTPERAKDSNPAHRAPHFLLPVPEDLRPSLRADLVAAFDAQRGPEGVATRGWGVLFVATRI